MTKSEGWPAPAAGRGTPRDVAGAVAALGRLAREAPGTEADLQCFRALLPDLTGRALADLCRIASRWGVPDLLGAVIREVAARETVPPDLAFRVLRLAHDMAEPVLADAVERALGERLGTGRRGLFRMQADLLRNGPLTALASARGRRMAGRTPPEAAELANLLQQAGRKRLALRYLRRCHRRWPNARLIRNRLLDAHLQLGDLAGAGALVAQVAERTRPSDLASFRLPFDLEAGDRADAIAAMQRLAENDPEAGVERQLLLFQAASGDLEAVKQAADLLRRSLRATPRLERHFQASHVGALVNELQILTRFGGGEPHDETPVRDEVAAFFRPACRVLDTMPPAGGGGAPVPKRIVQYWNRPEPEPVVAEIMASWQDRPGWRYERYHRRSAAAWLTERFGRDHARAFLLAHHVAQESDFFRLCALYSEGGIYADADDMLIGKPEDLAALGSGIVLFREPFGAVSNNLVLAAPGHRVLEKAIELALTSLLGRENDNTWSKTGPGLLTRATALHLMDAEAGQSCRDTTLLPRRVCGPFVKAHMRLPYKATARYWNSEAGPSEATVLEALRALADVTR